MREVRTAVCHLLPLFSPSRCHTSDPPWKTSSLLHREESKAERKDFTQDERRKPASTLSTVRGCVPRLLPAGVCSHSGAGAGAWTAGMQDGGALVLLCREELEHRPDQAPGVGSAQPAQERCSQYRDRQMHTCPDLLWPCLCYVHRGAQGSRPLGSLSCPLCLPDQCPSKRKHHPRPPSCPIHTHGCRDSRSWVRSPA